LFTKPQMSYERMNTFPYFRFCIWDEFQNKSSVQAESHRWRIILYHRRFLKRRSLTQSSLLFSVVIVVSMGGGTLKQSV